MVLKKRLDYGFSGYRAPIIPRAPRSERRRGSQKKAEVDSQICAFELLAAVAGKLLQESASSASSNAGGKYQLDDLKDGVKQEQLEEDKALKCERLDLGSCAESNFVSELRGQELNAKSTLQEFIRMDSDSLVGRSSINTNSDFSKKVGSDTKSEICENKDAVGSLPTKLENKIGSHLEVDEKQTIVLATDICVNTGAFINSDSSVQLTSYRDRVPNTYFPRRRNDVKVGIRDDDENSARCNQPSTKIRAFRPQSRIGYRRIRKLLASKYWKVAPKLKDCEVSNTNGERKAIYRNRRSFHTYERCQHEAPCKRRKLCGHSSTAPFDREASTESISNIPEKGTKAEKSVSAAIFDRANRVSSSVVSRQESFKSRDSHVKFSIKSFKVPELYIEVPQSSTVGSLKRTVMEAVTAILSGGLHVGVLLQGKKVRDDNRTLLQTGISHNGDLDSLGFTLEPSSAQASPLFPDDPPVLLPCEAHQQLIRSPASPIMDSGFTNESFDPPPLTKLDHHIESNHGLVLSPTAVSTEETVPDSRALVARPSMSVEALAMVPMNPKTRRTELGQRRTRRPFSVSEVEALVEAVETLGTGRWRDVKLRAFDNADHRTYVDLKDKWKTLVHTASIAPQQRRGQPVPQELLDRVLSAHAYWSQHQTKQHLKNQIEPPKSSETQVGSDGV